MSELTTTQAAQLLGLSRSHLRRLIRDGKVSGRKVGRDWLIVGSEIERLREKGTMGRPRAGPSMD